MNLSQAELAGKILCRDHERPEGCKFGNLCKFYHDPSKVTLRVSKTDDCVFWMEGDCKYESRLCRNIHDPDKFGTKEKFRRQELNGGKAQKSFLVQNLAGVGQVSDGNTSLFRQSQLGSVANCLQPGGLQQGGAYLVQGGLGGNLVLHQQHGQAGLGHNLVVQQLPQPMQGQGMGGQMGTLVRMPMVQSNQTVWGGMPGGVGGQ